MTTITKSLDKSGRIVIPMEMLKAIGLERGELVRVSATTEDGQPALILTKYHTNCVLCGEVVRPGTYREIMNKIVCLPCIEDFKHERA